MVLEDACSNWSLCTGFQRTLSSSWVLFEIMRLFPLTFWHSIKNSNFHFTTVRTNKTFVQILALKSIRNLNTVATIISVILTLTQSNQLRNMHRVQSFPGPCSQPIRNYSKKMFNFLLYLVFLFSFFFEAFVISYKLSLRWKISAIWLVEAACIFLILLFVTVQISVEYETLESEVWYTKHLNLQ